jgi:hypothetical protein
MVVSVCKKKNKFIYDDKGNIQEKVLLPLNFTVDIRFINLVLAKDFIADVKINKRKLNKTILILLDF